MRASLPCRSAVPGRHCVAGVADAGHGAALFPGSDDQLVEAAIRAKQKQQGGRESYARNHPELVPKYQDTDVRYAPVLSEPDSVLEGILK